MAVAQPVWRDVLLDPRPRGRRLYDPQHLARVERSAGARAEHRIARPALAPQRSELPPDCGRQQYRARLAALTEDGHLAGVVARLYVAPAQTDQLRSPEPAGVEE